MKSFQTQEYLKGNSRQMAEDSRATVLTRDVKAKPTGKKLSSVQLDRPPSDHRRERFRSQRSCSRTGLLRFEPSSFPGALPILLSKATAVTSMTCKRTVL